MKDILLIELSAYRLTERWPFSLPEKNIQIISLKYNAQPLIKFNLATNTLFDKVFVTRHNLVYNNRLKSLKQPFVFIMITRKTFPLILQLF